MFNTLASSEVISKTVKALQEKKAVVHVVEDKVAALAKLKEVLPMGAQIMTGSSTTLEQIGFVDLLKSGNHGWNNMKDAIVAEKDPEKQNELRKQSISSEYFIVSVHALTENGEYLMASASGSQIPSTAFASNNVVLVIGAQKIVPSIEEGIKRIKQHVMPLEDVRMKSVGYPGTMLAKLLISFGEIMPTRTITIILVNEVLGF
ncbi:lactate utilization protein [Candidatus Gracilibacteria bacterium]|nr:lactate utilization protein [Candidatus Gracilibacteria bacterium]